MKGRLLTALVLLCGSYCFAQTSVRLQVRDVQSGQALPGAVASNADSSVHIVADGRGVLQIQEKDLVNAWSVQALGYHTQQWQWSGHSPNVTIHLVPLQKEMEAVVISGTLRPVSKLESPVAVEVYQSAFFKKNPAPSLFESMQQVNGVRPQLNCSVCNTGDIHINGLEGPYTMITIDGMPIVSSLGSVYGLFGIPTQLIDRVEIVKGPASGLYGPEAIGGLINVITKEPGKAPRLAVNLNSTSWQEHNLDLGIRWKIGKKADVLTGVDYFRYQHPIDRNDDRFTDVTLQHRISIFQKLQLKRREGRVFSLAARYFYEDRWGGEMNWKPELRGSDSVYGESIYTRRWELIGRYQLPVKGNWNLSFSATSHQQNSWYGTTPYMGDQRVGFAQLVWQPKSRMRHNWLIGAALRYNYYDDNSTATLDTFSKKNRPDRQAVPGLFIQDEWKPGEKHSFLFGSRLDYHPTHGTIYTPRFAWKWKTGAGSVFRLNAGTGFRVVNLFTEDHAALTGARVVEIKEELQPEKSYNINLNFAEQRQLGSWSIQWDVSAWYSHFRNQIIADYDTDPQKIIYDNLEGHARSSGVSLNTNVQIGHRLRWMLGATWQDVRKKEKDEPLTRPVLTERWSAVWQIGYTFTDLGLVIDYTGNIYGPMRLPLLSPLDPRPAYSPVWSIQNIQLTKRVSPDLEFFGGVKNLLNWTAARSVPFLIARSNDPFDKEVEWDANGQAVPTPGNPYGLSFDPSYVYAPNQGIRFFGGLRWTVR
ncbi:MAG: TonB-dependent receptor plug domain-containing protein [Chitinophagaceae bacterium]